MILEKKLLQEVLAAAMTTGADFAEIYAERTLNDSVHLLDRKIDQISNNVVSGAGIRAFKGTRTVYASTSDLSREGLLRCARSVAAAMGEGDAPISICLTERMFPNIHPARI
ncbi:MAG: TldD/PmbA family protein, partial [Clostridia bacterium]|nr:TldD/PmbA family protein [Clostridia bacterium]